MVNRTRHGAGARALRKKNISTDAESKFHCTVSSSGDDFPEADGSSASQEVCSIIEQLPVEVLEKIFKYVQPVVSGTTYRDLRRVCKTWCDVLSQKQRVVFYFQRTIPYAELENCAFQNITGLQLSDVDLRKLPLDMWKKIGCRVNCLVLERCKILDQCWKNIIVHCGNLRSLKVDNANQFCSLNMLRNLCITRENLISFEIINEQNNVNITKWILIFENFFHVFPNVTRLTSGCRYKGTPPNVTRLSCRYKGTTEKVLTFIFSKKLDKDTASGLATCMACSLSTNDSHQRQALGASSALRFDDESLPLNISPPSQVACAQLRGRCLTYQNYTVWQLTRQIAR